MGGCRVEEFVAIDELLKIFEMERLVRDWVSAIKSEFAAVL